MGIDNGLDGGLCALDSGGRITHMRPMPVLKRKDKREVDVTALVDWLDSVAPFTFLRVWVEEPLRHARSSQALRSMGISYGKITGACVARNIETHSVDPQTWQRALLGRVPAGDTKAAALSAARKLHPEQDFHHSKPRGKPLLHDGMVDACLIARWGFGK